MVTDQMEGRLRQGVPPLVARIDTIRQEQETLISETEQKLRQADDDRNLSAEGRRASQEATLRQYAARLGEIDQKLDGVVSVAQRLLADEINRETSGRDLPRESAAINIMRARAELARDPSSVLAEYDSVLDAGQAPEVRAWGDNLAEVLDAAARREGRTDGEPWRLAAQTVRGADYTRRLTAARQRVSLVDRQAREDEIARAQDAINSVRRERRYLGQRHFAFTAIEGHYAEVNRRSDLDPYGEAQDARDGRDLALLGLPATSRHREDAQKVLAAARAQRDAD
ncbi:MAG TPA: hypothetical protein PLD23_10390, partial [Armatimonadota bacterium]|nr:hypothetical protein [Armatimonadota bacterium]